MMRRVRLWILVIGMVWCGAGCLGGSGDPPLIAVGNEPDGVAVVDGMTIRRYGAGHPVTAAVVDRLVTHAAVQQELQRFAKVGYSLDRAASLLLEAERPDATRLVLGILALSRPGPSELSALHLFCMDGSQGFVVLPVRVRASDAPRTVHRTTWESPADRVVLEVIDPLDPFPGPGPAPARWNWGRWASCVGAIIAYSAARCSTQCLLTGPGFWHCFTVCVTPRVVGGIAGCTFRELEGGD